MSAFHFKGVLTEKGWKENVTVKLDDEGKIVSLLANVDGTGAERINGYAIPGFQNAHSHAFQYAMAGLAERHATNQTPDDFWSWREAMYALALTISPDDLEAIAAMLYAEMVRHGYTHVAEFHYVHHDKDGRPYGNLAEMGERLVAAAKQAGIGITLVPIFYQKGGFGKPPVAGQRRFISENEEVYYRLLAASEKACAHYKHANVGVGIHSMRGVDPVTIAHVAQNGPQDLPFHIHVSEQLKEIEDALAYLGQRPVEWLLNNVNMSERFHLVHATHLTDAETDGIAATGANVVLCPSTEGNLGDGIFPLRRFQGKGGNWSIGTDSHVGLNPFEELRILDYGQRLISHKRNTYYSKNQGDSGLFAYEKALIAGRKAMNNFNTDYFAPGDYFNAVVVDANAPLIASSGIDNMASTILYCTDASMQLGTFAQGIWQVQNGKHIHQERIVERFKTTILQLKSRL